jgi:hypothetical protein
VSAGRLPADHCTKSIARALSWLPSDQTRPLIGERADELDRDRADAASAADDETRGAAPATGMRISIRSNRASQVVIDVSGSAAASANPSERGVFPPMRSSTAETTPILRAGEACSLMISSGRTLTATAAGWTIYATQKPKSFCIRAPTPSITMKITTSELIIITVRMVPITFGRPQHLRWVGICVKVFESIRQSGLASTRPQGSNELAVMKSPDR